MLEELVTWHEAKLVCTWLSPLLGPASRRHKPSTVAKQGWERGRHSRKPSWRRWRLSQASKGKCNLHILERFAKQSKQHLNHWNYVRVCVLDERYLFVREGKPLACNGAVGSCVSIFYPCSTGRNYGPHHRGLGGSYRGCFHHLSSAQVLSGGAPAKQQGQQQSTQRGGRGTLEPVSKDAVH